MYFILETQVTDGVGSALPIKTANTKNQAMSIYHTILASASISEVERHTCIVVDEEGNYLAKESYKHPRPVEGGEES